MTHNSRTAHCTYVKSSVQCASCRAGFLPLKTEEMLGCFTIVALLWADTGCVSLVVPALFFEHYSSVGFVHLCSTFVLSLSFGCCCLRIRPHTHFSQSYNIIPLFPDRASWHYPHRTRAVVLQLTYFTLWSRGLVCHLNVCWHHHWPHLRREKCQQRALLRDRHYCYTVTTAGPGLCGSFPMCMWLTYS